MLSQLGGSPAVRTDPQTPFRREGAAKAPLEPPRRPVWTGTWKQQMLYESKSFRANRRRYGSVVLSGYMFERC